MKSKNSRLDAIKIIISCKEIGSQEELLQELAKEGFRLTQATLSRDLKQLKVAKAASMNGNYVYVLPNNTMYKRMTPAVWLMILIVKNLMKFWELLPEMIPLCLWCAKAAQRPG